jgi:hypothetical protein
LTFTPDEDNLTVGWIVGLTTTLGPTNPGEDVTVFVVVVVTRPGFEVVTVLVTLNPPPPPRLIIDRVYCASYSMQQECAKK